MENGFADDAAFDAIDERVKTAVQASVDFAEASPYPAPHELYEDVYVENDYPFIKD